MHPEPEVNEPESVTTIILDNRDSSLLKRFRCHNCGKVSFEYYNDVQVMIPGRPGYIKNQKVYRCHGKYKDFTPDGREVWLRCKQKYYLS